jgi:hypothetical protein
MVEKSNAQILFFSTLKGSNGLFVHGDNIFINPWTKGKVFFNGLTFPTRSMLLGCKPKFNNNNG